MYDYREDEQFFTPRDFEDEELIWWENQEEDLIRDNGGFEE